MKKEIFLPENPEKIKKRLFNRLTVPSLFTRFRIGDDGRFYGTEKNGKYRVFTLSPFVFSFFGAVLIFRIYKEKEGAKIVFRFSRPLWANIFFGIAFLAFIAAGLFVLTEDVLFAAELFLGAAATGAYLFFFRKKTKEKLLSVLDRNKFCDGGEE